MESRFSTRVPITALPSRSGKFVAVRSLSSLFRGYVTGDERAGGEMRNDLGVSEMNEVRLVGETVGTQPQRAAWQAPVLKKLPRLTELTLQTGGSIPGGGGTGGGGSTVV